MRLKQIILSITICVLLFSCKQKTSFENEFAPDSSLTINHANGFSIDYFPDYKKITLYNPWEKDTPYLVYYLTKEKSITTPTNGQTIQIPIQSIAATSGTHFEFLHLINEIESITGICAPHLVYNSFLFEKYAAGKLTNLGNPFSINIEKVQLLKPDAVMLSGFNQDDPISKRLSEMHIPVVINNEWTETSLLARAEWIKFVAAFYDKESLADSIFQAIEERYDSIRNKLRKNDKKPSILSGGNFKGTWYMPGGNSYMAKLFEDAGGAYFYRDDESQASLPLNFEVVLMHFNQADIWVGSSANSLKELTDIDERHSLFQAYKRKQVYNFNARTNTSGANDFWESAVARPDIVLADMIKALHPEQMENHDFFYMQKLD